MWDSIGLNEYSNVSTGVDYIDFRGRFRYDALLAASKPLIIINKDKFGLIVYDEGVFNHFS